ncbi:MAG: hypothetical protein ACT4PM_05370 [Gemmatimonadales bacterium]
MRQWRLALCVLGAVACQEQLAVPSKCPDLCPGSGLTVRDTVLLPVANRDSSYTGYLGAFDIPALLVSSGLPVGEARTWAIFQDRPDSIFVQGIRYAYTIDSAAIQVTLVGRDTAVKNLYLVVHRIPLGVDTTTTFEGIDSLLTPESVVDSSLVPDTLQFGTARVVIPSDKIGLLDPVVPDSFFAIAFRVSAAAPTGVRLSSAITGAGGPQYLTYVQVPTPDTTLRKQTITVPSDTSNYVWLETPPDNPDALFLGGKSGSRILLRFALPALLRDSAIVLRATLELTPTGPIGGVPNDPAQLQARPVLVDVGPKSSASASSVGVLDLVTGSTETQSIEVRGPITEWFGPNGLTPALLLGIVPDGGTFSRPQFHSTRTGGTAPRLRLTYALATRPGFP